MGSHSQDSPNNCLLCSLFSHGFLDLRKSGFFFQFYTETKPNKINNDAPVTKCSYCFVALTFPTCQLPTPFPVSGETSSAFLTPRPWTFSTFPATQPPLLAFSSPSQCPSESLPQCPSPLDLHSRESPPPWCQASLPVLRTPRSLQAQSRYLKWHSVDLWGEIMVMNDGDLGFSIKPEQ